MASFSPNECHPILPFRKLGFVPQPSLRATVTLIEEADQIAVSCISCLEVAWLAKHQRIYLEIPLEQWMTLVANWVDILPVTNQIALQSVALPEHHRDPMDRLIISTALLYQAQLLSLDNEFTKYREDGLQLIIPSCYS